MLKLKHVPARFVKIGVENFVPLPQGKYLFVKTNPILFRFEIFVI